MRRRSVLAGALAAPVVLGLGFKGLGMAQGLPSLTLYDARLRPADRAASLIRLRGGDTRQTEGEIAALLLRERLFAKGEAMLGITGHAEYLLAADIARMAGRKVVPLVQVGSNLRWFGSPAAEEWRPLLADMFESRDGNAASTATAYAWVAA